MAAAAPPSLTETAPAKINLTLRVLGRRADGYHELEGLTAFACFGDRLTLTPGRELSLQVGGPMAAQAGQPDENLVLRAVRALQAQIKGLTLGAFVLEKSLPAGAGLGGGSADAAAALRLLARANGLDAVDPKLLTAALATGADIPVCVESKPRIMRGVGEVLAPPIDLPPLALVLLYPGTGLATGGVFAALKLTPGQRLSAPSHRGIPPGRAEFLAWLAEERNDLEPPALALMPVIQEMKAVLARSAGCELARMSGSGSACFGIFSTAGAAARAAAAITEDHPNWWVRATTLA